MDIRFVSARETYPLRHRVLRPQQTIIDCQYPLDFDEQTIHVGAFIDEQLISIASFYHEHHPELNGALQYRLRGMATDVAFRNRKAATSLVEFAETQLRTRDVNLWWCNARTTASSYYLRLGAHTAGGVFDLPGIGPHVVMYKSL